MGAGLKILLLGDYSNCHRTLATGLRQLGCDVTVVSDGSRWMQVENDISIQRGEGRLGGLVYWLRLLGPWHRFLRGYDIVAVNDMHAFQLRPKRIRGLFDRLRKDNGRLFYTAMSTDVPYIDMVSAEDSPLRYSEWFVDGKPSRWHEAEKEQWMIWNSADVRDFQNYAFDRIDGAVSVLYEYHLAMERRLGPSMCAYGGIPVDVAKFSQMMPLKKNEKVRIFLGRDVNRQAMKGSDYLEQAARKVVATHPETCELTVVENRPFKEFVGLLGDSDIVLDQIYSYSPATTALMAMSMGKAVVSGGEDEYYNFIGETTNRPIINAPLDVDGLTAVIEKAVLYRDELARSGAAGAEFVRKHNDCTTVARRFLEFWTSKM